MTKVWHPNISSVTGAICLDILSKKWSASLTLQTVLLSVQCLMASPDPGNPQDAVVGTQAINHPDVFQVGCSMHWQNMFPFSAPFAIFSEDGYLLGSALRQRSGHEG